MTREKIKKCIEVMQAYVDGKTIQVKTGTCLTEDGFEDVEYPDFNWHREYRIKEEPKPKPFDWRGKNIQWIRPKDNPTGLLYHVLMISLEGIEIATLRPKAYEPIVQPEELKWEFLQKSWQWSEDNTTWRRFV